MTTLALEKALFDYLTSDPNVENLVSDRVYPIRVPEGAQLPAVTYARVSANRIYTHDAFEDTNAFVRTRIQINCWSTKADEALEIGEAVMLALSGYEGDMSGTLIGASFVALEMDQYEGESKLFRKTLDFQIMYEDNLSPSS